ncbi:MAG TPA: hypothetical protein VGF45_18535, partial [Polyangia bacterium]
MPYPPASGGRRLQILNLGHPARVLPGELQAMPADVKPRRVPTYRLHKNSGRALTTIAGDYFLGRYGSP